MALDTMKMFGVTQQRYDDLMMCNDKFIAGCHDVTKEQVNVFPPLPQKSVEELKLIREISGTLQEQKDEYLKLAAQQAEEAKKIKENEDKKAEEEKAKEEENKAEEEKKAEEEEKKEE